MSDHHAPVSESKPSLLSNVLAIIGLIILVIIIVWGLVHLAELSSGWFSSLFKKSTPAIQMTAPADAISGTPVSISWNYSTSASGSYAFLYQCQEGLQFATIDATKNTATGIPCGTADAITPSNNSVQLLPILSGTTSASVPYSIIFTPASGTAVEGSATMTIHPGSAASGSAQVTSSQTTQHTTSTTKPATTAAPVRTYTPADLSVRIIAESVDQYGNGVVTFNISNVGGSTSGAYYFSAQMPTANPTPYSSSLQAPLTPGSYIVDTLRFTQAVSGTFSVTINAGDRNQSNDYASQWITAAQNNVYNPYTQYQTYPYTY
jgi:hypothetical protein